MPAEAAINQTTLVSRAKGASGVGGNNDSDNPTISGDGRFVDFGSDATNFNLGDDPAYTDVFDRDRVTNDLGLASMSTAGYAGDSFSHRPSISDSGQFVAFESGAKNLGGTTASSTNVYLRDLINGTTRLVSLNSSGQAADYSSYNPSVSANGRYVAFESYATNLSSADAPGYIDDVFVRDLFSGKTTLVSVTGAGVAGNKDSFWPSISANGCRIAFRSAATNLAPGANRNYGNIYVRDRCAGTTELVSRASGAGGPGANQSSYDPSISPDGRYVAFDTSATNLNPLGPFVDEVYLRDLSAKKTILVSRANGPNGAPSTGTSSPGSIRAVSSGGKRVVFDSHGDNLSAQDNDDWMNVYVRDIPHGTTTLVSRASGASGKGGNYGSSDSAISADGRFVAFASDATNLAPGANRNSTDVFVRDLGP